MADIVDISLCDHVTRLKLECFFKYFIYFTWDKPHRETDNLCNDPCPEPWWWYGMTDGNIPICRENHQEQGARDLVDGCCGVVDLAHGHPKRPLSHRHRCDQKWNSREETFIRHGQMQDIGIGYCVHFGESKYENEYFLPSGIIYEGHKQLPYRNTT